MFTDIYGAQVPLVNQDQIVQRVVGASYNDLNTTADLPRPLGAVPRRPSCQTHRVRRGGQSFQRLQDVRQRMPVPNLLNASTNTYENNSTNTTRKLDCVLIEAGSMCMLNFTICQASTDAARTMPAT